MTQVYVAVGKRRRIELPIEISNALGVREGEWFLVSVLDGDCAIVRRVPVEVPDDVQFDRYRSSSRPT
jgi:hypothetical protein